MSGNGGSSWFTPAATTSLFARCHRTSARVPHGCAAAAYLVGVKFRSLATNRSSSWRRSSPIGVGGERGTAYGSSRGVAVFSILGGAHVAPSLGGDPPEPAGADSRRDGAMPPRLVRLPGERTWSGPLRRAGELAARRT